MLVSIRHLGSALIAVLFSSAVAAAQPQAGQPVIAARESYNRALATRDLAAMRAVLSPTYHIVLGRSSQSHGPDATMMRMQASFASDSLYNCVRTPDHVDMNAAWGLAQESGRWRCRYAGVPAGAPEGSATGTYNAKWQRDTGGTWRLQAEIFTTLTCAGRSPSCAAPDPVPASSAALPSLRGSSADAVRASRAWYNAAMKRGDADAIVSLYTPDFHAVFGRGRHYRRRGGGARRLAHERPDLRAYHRLGHGERGMGARARTRPLDLPAHHERRPRHTERRVLREVGARYDRPLAHAGRGVHHPAL